jgi:putative tricarboxylic transport membrane protein
MFIGNIFLVILNILLVGILVRILDTPPKVLYPLILVLAFIGTYTLNYSVIDFYILVIFGVVGLSMKLLKFPIAPLILAVIVGTDMEQNFRKSLVAHEHFVNVFIASPATVILTILTILSIAYPFLIGWIRKRKQARA